MASLNTVKRIQKYDYHDASIGIPTKTILSGVDKKYLSTGFPCWCRYNFYLDEQFFIDSDGEIKQIDECEYDFKNFAILPIIELRGCDRDLNLKLFEQVELASQIWIVISCSSTKCELIKSFPITNKSGMCITALGPSEAQKKLLLWVKDLERDLDNNNSNKSSKYKYHIVVKRTNGNFVDEQWSNNFNELTDLTDYWLQKYCTVEFEDLENGKKAILTIDDIKK